MMRIAADAGAQLSAWPAAIFKIASQTPAWQAGQAIRCANSGD
ncbi:hypothetical protein [Paucibacter sp. TC2R-5]|nr:hypothetical protein [Paucibacter sp. TC2R-5]